MRFGLFGGPVARPKEISEADAYQEYVDYVVQADKLGFESVFLTEHHFTGLGQASSPLGLLSHFAACTAKIRLGTAVTVLNWYNPITIAEQAATVDVLSGGRLDFGVGRGFRAAEYDGFCIPMDEAQERYDEALEVIVRAWTETDRWSHAGARWRFADVICEPRPLQSPPPLWIGAGSPKSLKSAAENGFNLLLDQIASFDEIGERIAIYRGRQAEMGVDPATTDVAVTRALYLVDDENAREEAILERERILGAIATLAKGHHATPQNRMSADYMTDVRRATEAGAIIGDPSECSDRLRTLGAAGADYVLLQDATTSGATLQRFADEVIPKLDAVGTAS